MAVKSKGQKRSDKVNEVYSKAFTQLYESFVDELTRSEKGDTIQPWLASPLNMQPINAKTGNFYKGINAVMLEQVVRKHTAETGVCDNRFVAFGQAKELGLKMRKGSKSVPVLFYQTERSYEDVDQSTGEVKQVKQKLAAPRRIYHNVFHMSCFENAPPLPDLQDMQSPFERSELVDKFLNQTGADIIHHDGDRCYYKISQDKIYMVEPNRFQRIEDYYGVALHEKIHSAGHESRLNIESLTGGDDPVLYAKDEIRAEIGATMLLRKLHISLPLKLDSDYIYKYLNDIPREEQAEAFINGVYQASKSSDYLIEQSGMKPEIDAYEQQLSNAITSDLTTALEAEREKDVKLSSENNSISIG
ncbi:zincin-like metallopeptidase domain-containing protein [Photobacterium leiognathi]|uniref:zincin-like metallopeptidase domain-containing protein n=1 Tax=Photobacterium leiognathi TaxID=553611 RepID=UPI002982A641|nr:zincin-like metallopeptidase domain-containing protein [Photobacterium leiognathi]